MLLNDIGSIPNTTLKKINQHLESNYGFKLSENVKVDELDIISENIQNEITDLKIKGDDAKHSPEISKRLLVLEGLKQLKEYAMLGPIQSPKLDTVINSMTDFVVNTFNHRGVSMDDFEDAMSDAMKVYRASKYDFPNEMIEAKVRERALPLLGGPTASPMVPEEVQDFGVDEIDLSEDFEPNALMSKEEYLAKKKRLQQIQMSPQASKDPTMKQKIMKMAAMLNQRAQANGFLTAEETMTDEGSVWDNIGKRDNADSGHAPLDLDVVQQRTLGKIGFKAPATPTQGEKIPTVRDKFGRMVQDPFAANAAARRSGVVHEDDDMNESEMEEAVRVFGKTGLTEPTRHYNKDPSNPEATAHRNQTAAMAKQARADGKLTGGTNPKMDKHVTVTPNSQKASWSPERAIVKTRSTEGTEMKENKNLVKHLRALLETEVSQAEVMMAAKGFAQELQEMVEKIGRLQNEDLPPVTDQMRETYGMESASAFQTQIYGALQSVMDSLYTAKGQVDDAVANMASTGQVTAQVDMDKDMSMDPNAGVDDMSMDAELDLDNIGDDLAAGAGDEMGDEFGGAEEEEPLGRSMKTESAQQLRRKIAEMQKIVAKAKKLKEAQKR